jgi:hypothetical protein
VPASFLSSRFALGIEGPLLRRSFGAFLVVGGTAFTVFRLVTS